MAVTGHNCNMITSKENAMVKYVKSLSQKKYREIQKEYVIEGYKMLKEAIENEQEISLTFFCEDLWNGLKEEKEWLEKNGLKLELVSKNVFCYLADTVTPQGVLAVVKEKSMEKQNYSNIIFALDDLQDPGNLGTIIRTLDAAGYQDLIVSQGTAEVYNPKVVRSTMGAIFRVNFYKVTNLQEKLQEMKQKGYQVVVTSLDTNSYYYDLNFQEKLVIVIGNEAKGVSQEIQEMADRKIKIPMLGKTESLNAAVATSILAYEGVRQKVATQKTI